MGAGARLVRVDQTTLPIRPRPGAASLIWTKLKVWETGYILLMQIYRNNAVKLSLTSNRMVLFGTSPHLRVATSRRTEILPWMALTFPLMSINPRIMSRFYRKPLHIRVLWLVLLCVVLFIKLSWANHIVYLRWELACLEYRLYGSKTCCPKIRKRTVA